MQKINLYLINFFNFMHLAYNFIFALIMPNTCFKPPTIEKYPNVYAVNYAQFQVNINNRFFYMLDIANYSSTIMYYWTRAYCILWFYKKITFNGKKFKDNFPFSIVDLD